MKASCCCLATIVFLVSHSTLAAADVLYDSTILNANGGGINAQYEPSPSGGYLLMDDITVPAGGWTLDAVSTYFGTVNSPATATNALLILFDKQLGMPNPMDYTTVVPVTMALEEFTDPNNGFSRTTRRYDASGLNVPLAPGDYWIGLAPINTGGGFWMAWGSRTANDARPIYWDVAQGTYTTYLGLWTGPDMMLRVSGIPGVTGTPDAPVAAQAGLHAWPNPVVGPMTVTFDLAHSGHVRMDLVDVAGRVVENCFDGVLPSGQPTIRWEPTGLGKGQRSPGVYFVRMQADGMRLSKRIVVMER